jgi:hypothetical protein
MKSKIVKLLAGTRRACLVLSGDHGLKVQDLPNDVFRQSQSRCRCVLLSESADWDKVRFEALLLDNAQNVADREARRVLRSASKCMTEKPIVRHKFPPVKAVFKIGPAIFHKEG